MKTAIIDIGSNSVRYALFDRDTRLAQKELNSTVLADGLFFSGRLSPEAMERTKAAVCAFCDKARRQNADEIRIFATEAVRAASNGKEFTQSVRCACGVPVDVLSGTQEAQIGFSGALPNRETDAAVFDIGGGSCEIICGRGDCIYHETSSPIGCVRLRDGANGDRAKAERMIAAALPSVLPSVLPARRMLIGIGGTATALGGMLCCPTRYDPLVTHGCTVPLSFLERVADEFFAREDMLSLYPSLSPARARIIGYGALAAMRILDLFGERQFTVSERDNMEGYYESVVKK